jgi:hypothetical protein
MAQGILPYKHEEERTTSNMTSLAGLPVYLDLASARTCRPRADATLDMDAALIETQKEDALFSYKGFKA